MYIIIVDNYTCGIKKIEFDYVIIDIFNIDISLIKYNNGYNLYYIIGKYIFIDRFGFNPLSCMNIERDFTIYNTKYLTSYTGFYKYKKTLLIKPNLEEINDLIEKYINSFVSYKSYYNIYDFNDERIDTIYQNYISKYIGQPNYNNRYIYIPKNSDTIIFDIKKLYTLYELAMQKVIQNNLYLHKLIPTDIINDINNYNITKI